MSPSEAKRIIESLAIGADPETGEVFSEQSILNDPAVIRALFIASRALERVKPENLNKPALSNAGRSWSADEDSDLVASFDSGMPLKAIAEKHGRTLGAITSRLIRHGRVKEQSTPLDSRAP